MKLRVRRWGLDGRKVFGLNRELICVACSSFFVGV